MLVTLRIIDHADVADGPAQQKLDSSSGLVWADIPLGFFFFSVSSDFML